MTTKLPWFKFNPTDYRADPSLRMCSLAARGLWVEMLCIMHEADPRGHLLINKNPVTDRMLASLTGTDESSVSRLITELETAGVFSRSNKGVIYSRRMIRDEKLSQKRAKSGKIGAEVTHSKIKENNTLPRQKTGKGHGIKTKEERNKNTEVRNKPEEKDYVFDGCVIRLNRKDFEAWCAQYGGNEDQFWTYLLSRDAWYETQPPEKRKSWFVATARHLSSLQT